MGGTSQEAQRKAWNEAMTKTTSHPHHHHHHHHHHTSRPNSSTTLSLAKRRSDRHKKNSRSSSSSKNRREKARKSNLETSDSTFEGREYRLAMRMDALEEVVGVGDGIGGGEEEEEYDELEEALEAAGGGGSSTGNSSSLSKRKRRGGTVSTKKKKKITSSAAATGAGEDVPGDLTSKRFRPRSLSSILIEEAGLINGGNVHSYLNAEARRSISSTTTTTTRKISFYPTRNFCPVTGLKGIYKDSKSGIHYANLGALEQIRERVPFWLNVGGSGGGGGGGGSYLEAVKSLRNEE